MCGAVSFVARNLRHDFGVCHCKMCQRWAGSALVAITVPAADVDWVGLEHVGKIQSSDWAERAWCNTCGSGLWYRMTTQGDDKDDYEIPLGIFDDANGLEFTREIFTDRKPDSFAFAGDHERLTEAETLSRFGITVDGA
jgi:hypothetical protein